MFVCLWKKKSLFAENREQVSDDNRIVFHNHYLFLAVGLRGVVMNKEYSPSF